MECISNSSTANSITNSSANLGAILSAIPPTAPEKNIEITFGKFTESGIGSFGSFDLSTEEIKSIGILCNKISKVQPVTKTRTYKIDGMSLIIQENGNNILKKVCAYENVYSKIYKNLFVEINNEIILSKEDFPLIDKYHDIINENKTNFIINQNDIEVILSIVEEIDNNNNNNKNYIRMIFPGNFKTIESFVTKLINSLLAEIS